MSRGSNFVIAANNGGIACPSALTSSGLKLFEKTIIAIKEVGQNSQYRLANLHTDADGKFASASTISSP